MKRIISVLLTVALLLSLIPAGAVEFSLTASAAKEGDYTYSVSGGEATITDVKTSISGNVVIPSTLGGYPVTSIGEYAFSDCRSLASVTIGDSVTSLGACAFYYCDSLTSVTIGNGVTSIREYAFSCCYSLASVTIGNSVTSIGDEAFYNCTALQSVTMGNGVSYLRNYVFYGCTALTSFAIPSSVETIGEGAFSGCTALREVSIPISVKRVNYLAFSDCTALETVRYGGSEADRSSLLSYGGGSDEFWYTRWYYDSLAKVTVQPTAPSVQIGDVAQVTVNATGDGLTYVWYCKEPRAIAFVKTNQTMATYTATVNTDNNGQQVYCEITDAYGNRVVTDTVILHAHSYDNACDASCNLCGAMREVTVILGDVDGNGRINSTDARLVLQFAVKKIGAASLDTTAADVDGSGQINSTDARLILQYAVQKITKFPAE